MLLLTGVNTVCQHNISWTTWILVKHLENKDYFYIVIILPWPSVVGTKKGTVCQHSGVLRYQIIPASTSLSFFSLLIWGLENLSLLWRDNPSSHMRCWRRIGGTRQRRRSDNKEVTEDMFSCSCSVEASKLFTWVWTVSHERWDRRLAFGFKSGESKDLQPTFLLKDSNKFQFFELPVKECQWDGLVWCYKYLCDVSGFVCTLRCTFFQQLWSCACCTRRFFLVWNFPGVNSDRCQRLQILHQSQVRKLLLFLLWFNAK